MICEGCTTENHSPGKCVWPISCPCQHRHDRKPPQQADMQASKQATMQGSNQ